MWVHRVTQSDMPSHTFIVAIFAKDSESCSETAFQIFAFFVFVCKFGRPTLVRSCNMRLKDYLLGKLAHLELCTNFINAWLIRGDASLSGVCVCVRCHFNSSEANTKR